MAVFGPPHRSPAAHRGRPTPMERAALGHGDEVELPSSTPFTSRHMVRVDPRRRDVERAQRGLPP